MTAPSRQQFSTRVAEMVRAKFPLVNVEPVADSFSLLVNGHLSSLENVYRLTVLRPEKIQRHVNRWIVELLRAGEGTQDRNGTLAQLKDRLLPMILGVGDDEQEWDRVVSQPLVEGLKVCYAIDNDRTISYLLRDHFAQWKVPLESLHEQAMENLMSRSQSMEAHAMQDEGGQVNLIIFQKGDGYDASRILLPMLHEKLRGLLGSPFVAAVPNRDILLCFRDETQTVARLADKVAEDFRQMPHQVTDRLFLVTPDGIAPRSE